MIRKLLALNEPFAVVESYEIQGTIYTLVTGDIQIKSYPLKRDDINTFIANKRLFKQKFQSGYGHVFEFNDYRAKLYPKQRWNFIQGLYK